MEKYSLFCLIVAWMEERFAWIRFSWQLHTNRFCMENTVCCCMIVQISSHDTQRYIGFAIVLNRLQNHLKESRRFLQPCRNWTTKLAVPTCCLLRKVSFNHVSSKASFLNSLRTGTVMLHFISPKELENLLTSQITAFIVVFSCSWA